MEDWSGFLYILLFTTVLSFFLPWWIIVVPAFAAGLLMMQGSGPAFLSGFAAIFLSWAGYAFFLILTQRSELPEMMASLFGVANEALLILIASLVAGILGGLSSLSGFYLKRLF